MSKERLEKTLDDLRRFANTATALARELDIENPPSLQALANSIYRAAETKGFWENPTGNNFSLVYSQKLALIHSEVSEALEELRLPDFNVQKFQEELIDVLIRTLDLLGRLSAGWPLQLEGTTVDAALAKKMTKNKSRPRKHGKLF